MQAKAIVLDRPGQVSVAGLSLLDREPSDVLVDVCWSGISTGTEKLLFDGSMPPFPGMGYPLVPGYEAVGRVSDPGKSKLDEGDLVFVPGARCFKDAHALFGASASMLQVDGNRLVKVPETLGEDAVLLALAATAHHALTLPNSIPPGLIIGHGVVGRLMARIAIAKGWPAPIVWETNPDRRSGDFGYPVIDGDDKNHTPDPAKYLSIMDASGANGILDIAIQHLAKHGQVTLAGFYHQPLSFNFPPAFMAEANIRIAAEFTPDDSLAVLGLVESGALSLSGLITHHASPDDAQSAYETAFSDSRCLKMVLNWGDMR